MALQMNFTADDGTVYPECYITINYVQADPAESTLVVCYFADKAAQEAGADPIKVSQYSVATSMLDGGIFANAYTHLLTLPEFAGAQPVP